MTMFELLLGFSFLNIWSCLLFHDFMKFSYSVHDSFLSTHYPIWCILMVAAVLIHAHSVFKSNLHLYQHILFLAYILEMYEYLQKKVLLALEDAGVFTSGGIVKDKVTTKHCSTANGSQNPFIILSWSSCYYVCFTMGDLCNF